MLAGVAFFLLAMNFMEESLRRLAGRKFKLFLKRHTTSRLKAVGSGTLVTALLQSSSIVNLLVLSMVGAGVVMVENALALILGANLGTTAGNWLIAVLGFSVNIQAVVLPVAGITGIALAFTQSEKRIYLWLKFFFGFSFLFIALGFIKNGMEEWVRETDLTAFNDYPAVIFLLLGTVLTTVVQSSSATVALVLSALYANAITLTTGMAVVLGSEIGTTFKLFLASVKGGAAKKKVAMGNFIFNTVTAFGGLALLQPSHNLITDIFRPEDKLISLVFFQTLVNLSSILVFLPFLKVIGRLLTNLYPERNEETVYIRKIPVKDTDAATEALENETGLFIRKVISYSLDSFQLDDDISPGHSMLNSFNRLTIGAKYDHIKQLHGEMYAFCLRLQNTGLQKKELERIEHLISAIRNTMYAAKNIRDVQHDTEQVSNSSNDTKYDFYMLSREKVMKFSQQVLQMMDAGPGENNFEKLTSLYKSVTAGYPATLRSLYGENVTSHVNETEISTLINYNRELYTFFKSVLFGLKDFLLSVKEADYFDSLPGFIR